MAIIQALNDLLWQYLLHSTAEETKHSSHLSGVRTVWLAPANMLIYAIMPPIHLGCMWG